MRRASTIFPLLLVIALAAVTFWLERTVQMAAPSPRDTTRNDPDLVAHGVKSLQLDKTGRAGLDARRGQDGTFPRRMTRPN